MFAKIKAMVYSLYHREPVHLTVVRRYVDAQKHFIGELYLGGGLGGSSSAQMIGMTCDNLPFDIGTKQQLVKCAVCWDKDFTAPLDKNTIRVGGVEPSTNEHVRQEIALRRYCSMRISVLNRFIEHVMEEKSQ